MTRDPHPRADNPRALSPEVFAQLGTGHVGYLRQISSDDLHRLFPGTPEMARGLRLWALLGADGNPILVSDSREAAIANALETELIMVSVH
ncbi:DUF1150 family protein [Pannonibacter sp.]|uniref:BQ00720 family protein n=1 Tax=Pannonibacter sp. TaxID=1906786 RepID=UPI003F727D21